MSERNNFIDYIRIFCRSGHGGAGARHFMRNKLTAKGGPDGGDGGRGGHIILRGNAQLWTLLHMRYFKNVLAEHGEGGSKNNCTGHDGKDIILEVPLGTIAKDEETGNIEAEILYDGQEIIWLKGGRGGLGNSNFATPTNQVPEHAQPGEEGSEGYKFLELKVLADVGLLGMPNAGKSTFIAAVSNARPKIADYPFTTLHPNLGVVKVESYDFVLADIPGLIEGAHEGHGLGTRFLGHVERTAALLHLVDITSENPLENYRIIRNELEEYGGNLSEKHEIVALNKIDSIDKEVMVNIADQFEQELGYRPWLISGVTKEGIRPLLFKLVELIKENRAEEESATTDNRDNDHYAPENSTGYSE